MKNGTRLLSLVLCLVLSLTLTACGGNADDSSASATESETPASLPEIWESASYKEDTALGEGAKTLVVEVEAEGYSVEFTVKTDATTLGAALLELELIAGEQGAYGLYIKTVNGMLADYDVDGSYWALYQNGEYAMSGVDTTNINGGEHFELVRTK